MATPIEGLMGESLSKLKQMIDVNTIVGECINTSDGTTIIPLSKVTFGFGAGGSEFNVKPTDKSKDQAMFGGGCGGGVTVNPVAFLVVRDDNIRLLPVSGNTTTADKIIDLVPEVLGKLNKYIKEFRSKKKDEDDQ